LELTAHLNAVSGIAIIKERVITQTEYVSVTPRFLASYANIKSAKMTVQEKDSATRQKEFAFVTKNGTAKTVRLKNVRMTVQKMVNA
jgi:hypothetical protein